MTTSAAPQRYLRIPPWIVGRWIMLGLACGGVLLPEASGAQETVVAGPQRSVAATRVASGPGPDNWRLHPDWALAPVIADFIQNEPSEGAPATEFTEVRILYDDEAIYIGAWLYDSEADRITLGERRRDANLTRSDAFLILLDTFHDRQNGFVFGTNPGGIEYDGHVVNEGRGGGGGGGRLQVGAGGGFNINWDGSWTVRTEQDEAGWYAFFRIPFSTLRYGPGTDQTWGINMARYIGRKNEQVFWSPVPRQYNLYRVSAGGHLSELQVPSRRLLTVTPYALGSAQRIPTVHEGVRYPFEFGAEAKVGITQGMVLDLTVNTDFAQVEVDDQQVDLTRFSLLFPEKRPFFLENAGRFAVGNNRSAQMFFSRRIGISSSGTPVPIRAGSRLTGRAGGMDVGLIHMQTDGLDAVQPANAYSVVRLARELPNRSSVGAIFTQRSSRDSPGDWGRTYAVDGTLGIGEGFEGTAVVGVTDAPDVSGSRETILLSGSYLARDWRITGYYDQVGENFRPEVGFLRRADFRQTGGLVMRYVRMPSIPWLREFRPHVGYDISHSLDGFKETERLHLDVHVVWENGTYFAPQLDWVFDGLSRAEPIAPGVEVQAGRYSGWDFTPRFNTSTQAPVIFRTGADWGSFLSGARKGGFGAVEFQRGDTFAGEVRVQHHEIDLAEATFGITATSARIGYSFSPNLFVQSLVQYNSQSRIWSGNVRFGWVNTAGTGLFLVYNERQRENGFADPLERTLLVKFSRQLDVAAMSRDFKGR